MVDELGMSGSRLSNDSGYVDDSHAKNNAKLKESIPPSTKSLEDWKISGTLDQLAHIKIETPVEAKEKTETLAKHETVNKDEVNQKEETQIDVVPITPEDVQLKQKEEDLRLQRELFSSLANQIQPNDIISKTLRALEVEEQHESKLERKATDESEQPNTKETEQKLTIDTNQTIGTIVEDRQDAETERISDRDNVSSNSVEQGPPKSSLSPNDDKNNDEAWRLLNTPKDQLKDDSSGLLQNEHISVAPPTPRNEEVKHKRLKDLDMKREYKNSTSTEGSSLDTEAEQQKLAELGSTTTLLKSTLDKMHAEIGRLTMDQRELCRMCFQRIEKHPIPFGLSIMIRLFSNHPQYKDIWQQFKQIPDSSLIHAPELRRHARIYMAGLRLIINSMNDDKKLETSLRGIAQAHVKWHIHKFHLINMLPCVIEAFQTKFAMSVDQVQAWTTLFDVIANLIDIFRTH